MDEQLFQAICDALGNARTVIDLGAGLGRYVQRLRTAGYDAMGIDGIEGIYEASEGTVRWGDLTKPLLLKPGEWALSIEVGEHIPADFESVFFDNLAQSATTGLIISWAVPGQRGLNHINCHWPSYVVEQLGRREWKLSERETERARTIAGKCWSKKLLILRPQSKVVEGG